MNSRRLLGIGLLVLFCATIVGAYLIARSAILDHNGNLVAMQQAQGNKEDYRSQELTLQGTYICLPPRSLVPGSPVDASCQTGLRTEAGVSYSLDWNVINPVVEIGSKLKVKGLFTPIEMLSSDYLRNNYDVHGILSVKEIIAWTE